MKTNDTALTQALRHYTNKQWTDWIDDMLVYNIAHPYIQPSHAGLSDSLYDLLLLFKHKEISAESYISALIDKLIEIQNSEDAQYTERILETLEQCPVMISESEKLLTLLISKKLLISEKMKASLLMILHHTTLTSKQTQNVVVWAQANLRVFVGNPKFCGCLLRFQRKFIPSTTEFFETFLLILNAMSAEDFKKAKVTLVDKFEEMKFHYPNLMIKDAPKWQLQFEQSEYWPELKQDFLEMFIA